MDEHSVGVVGCDGFGIDHDRQPGSSHLQHSQRVLEQLLGRRNGTRCVRVAVWRALCHLVSLRRAADDAAYWCEECRWQIVCA